MDKITEHHYRNIAEGKTVDNPDGSLSTVKTATVEYDGVTYLIPTVWDGEILELEDAEKRAFSEGVYETFENETEARRFDALIHEDFFDTTTPEEAEMALSKSESRKGIKTREGEIMAEKKFQLDENEADTDGDGELSAYEKEKAEAIQKANADRDLEELELNEGSYLEKGIDTVFSPEGIVTGTSASLAGATHLSGADKKIYNALFNEDYTWTGSEEGAVKRGDLEGKKNFYKALAKSGANAIAKLGGPISLMLPTTLEDGTIPPELRENPEWIALMESGDGLTQNEEIPEMYHGGLMVGIDSETGNEIPPGSSADNVKDDIPAALSTGEYVLPADVVRWHGLKHIQDMMTEAKTGLMCMQMDGQIKDINDEPEIDEEEEDEKTPEGNEVEVAEVEVEIEEMELDDEMKEDEDYSKKKKRKSPSITSTPNVVYMTG